MPDQANFVHFVSFSRSGALRETVQSYTVPCKTYVTCRMRYDLRGVGSFENGDERWDRLIKLPVIGGRRWGNGVKTRELSGNQERLIRG